MKKKLGLVLFIFAVASFQTLSAQAYKSAIGLRLSNSSPTLNNAITGKYFLNESSALEGMLSFGSRFAVGALYEKHKPLEAIGLTYFFGAGAFVGLEGGKAYLGPTGIIGLDYKFETLPLNLSLDWKPELDILPRIAFIPDAFGLSARFTIN